MSAGPTAPASPATPASPARTPKGMHDVLWPESARWEDDGGALRHAGRGGRLRPRR